MRLIRATWDPKRRFAGLWCGPLYVGVLFGGTWRLWWNARPPVVRLGPLVATWWR